MNTDFSDGQILFLSLGALITGIYMLMRGGDLTVNGAVYIARRFGVPALLVGFTVVGFGTSLPEMIVAINANLKGSGDLALGNVLGSNIANILLVLGAAAIFAPLAARPKDLWRDCVMMLGASFILFGLMSKGFISAMAGGLMVALLIAYVLWQYLSSKNKASLDVEIEDQGHFKNMKAALLSLLGGLVFIALGAEFLVRGAHSSAVIIGIPDAVIGLTIVAIGTSLPELATAIAAARQRQTDILLGNIIGSNVFNILSIVGITALIKPFDESAITDGMLAFDAPVMIGVALMLTLIIFIFKKLNRFFGIFMLSMYAIYIAALVAFYFDPSKVPL